MLCFGSALILAEVIQRVTELCKKGASRDQKVQRQQRRAHDSAATSGDTGDQNDENGIAWIGGFTYHKHIFLGL